MITPVDVDRYKELLIESNYDIGETKFLVDGFRNGFTLGYEGDTNVRLTAPNLKFRGVGDKVILWNKVMKEVKLKHYTGPFSEIPFENYIQSLIGLVSKDNGKDVRLIFHLSYPRNTGKSVNENTPKSKCRVTYPDFSEAVQLCIRAGRSCKISKSDMTSAFRNLGIRPQHFRFLIMKAVSPIDGKTYFFLDKALPFGAAISCSHFQRFSNSIAHIVKFRTKRDLINYLDDYFFVALLKLLCDRQVQTFLDVCAEIRFPVSLDKTFWGTMLLTFLGLLIDTANQQVLIPVEKLEKAVNLIDSLLDKKSKKATVNQLQKLCGFLNFIGRYVILG